MKFTRRQRREAPLCVVCNRHGLYLNAQGEPVCGFHKPGFGHPGGVKRYPGLSPGCFPWGVKEEQ